MERRARAWGVGERLQQRMGYLTAVVRRRFT
jgi:hypothetical protein